MSNILNTLPEIREKIFGYCCTADLRSLACCNSVYNNALKQMLWQTVDIPLGSLENENFKSKRKCKNLQLTTTIRFHGDHSAMSEFNLYSRSNNTNTKKLKKISSNYRKILGYCKSGVLDALSLESAVINGEDIKYTCKSFNSLKTLTISHTVHVTPEEFEVIKKLDHLVELNLMYTVVGDQFLSIICDKLVNLKSLNIRRCGGVLNGGLALLKKMTSLEILDISGLEIDDAGIEHISTLINLNKLDISHCSKVTDEGILHLTKLISLRDINMSWCKQITNKNLHVLSELKFLRRLDIGRCPNIEDGGLSSICIITSLQEIYLNGCVCIGDPGVLNVSNKLSNLMTFHLVYTDVTDKGLKCLTNLQYLVELDITGCAKITDLGISYLTTFACLRKLNISCTQVTDDGLLHLRFLTNLRMLNVCNCSRLTDTTLSYVSTMISLQDLDIAFTNVTDGGLKYLNTLKSLRRLRCCQSNVSAEGLTELRSHISLGEIA